MTNVHRLYGAAGTADFTNYTKYHAPFASNSPQQQTNRIIVPIRGGGGAYLARSEAGALEWDVLVHCNGGGSYQAAKTNYDLITTLIQEARTRLLDTSATAIQTSTVFYEEKWGDQSTSTLYHVLDADWDRQPSSLNGRNIIIGRLHLFLTP